MARVIRLTTFSIDSFHPYLKSQRSQHILWHFCNHLADSCYAFIQQCIHLTAHEYKCEDWPVISDYRRRWVIFCHWGWCRTASCINIRAARRWRAVKETDASLLWQHTCRVLNQNSFWHSNWASNTLCQNLCSSSGDKEKQGLADSWWLFRDTLRWGCLL